MVSIGLAFFHIVPDATLVQQGADAVTQISTAIETKNWFTLLAIIASGNVINIVTKLRRYFKK